MQKIKWRRLDENDKIEEGDMWVFNIDPNNPPLSETNDDYVMNFVETDHPFLGISPRAMLFNSAQSYYWRPVELLKLDKQDNKIHSVFRYEEISNTV